MKTSILLAASTATILDFAAANVLPNSQPYPPPQSNEAYSPPFYPSPWMDPNAPGWEQAYAQAKEFVSGLTLLEKVNLTTGVG